MQHRAGPARDQTTLVRSGIPPPSPSNAHVHTHHRHYIRGHAEGRYERCHAFHRPHQWPVLRGPLRQGAAADIRVQGVSGALLGPQKSLQARQPKLPAAAALVALTELSPSVRNRQHIIVCSVLGKRLVVLLLPAFQVEGAESELLRRPDSITGSIFQLAPGVRSGTCNTPLV